MRALREDALQGKRARRVPPPLFMAARGGHAQTALFLLHAGADASQVDDMGRTPLHMAAYNGHVLAGLVLLRMGASCTAMDGRDRTPVTAAVSAGFLECAKALEDELRRPLPREAPPDSTMSIAE
mmetsp:Transcript_54269/g.172282  ORF Transcript_54269/g.172282 Transcript_54269/m.172282 type:complete len:125 (+) Transcript_54269:1963-2337(+)